MPTVSEIASSSASIYKSQKTKLCLKQTRGKVKVNAGFESSVMYEARMLRLPIEDVKRRMNHVEDKIRFSGRDPGKTSLNFSLVYWIFSGDDPPGVFKTRYPDTTRIKKALLQEYIDAIEKKFKGTRLNYSTMDDIWLMFLEATEKLGIAFQPVERRILSIGAVDFLIDRALVCAILTGDQTNSNFCSSI